MGDLTAYSRLRRVILLIGPTILMTRFTSGQTNPLPNQPGQDEDIRLPNGRKQRDEILKSDYEQNLKDAQELITIAKSFEEGLEKEDRFVFSLGSLKKLDDIERLTKRIRGRMKRY